MNVSATQSLLHAYRSTSASGLSATTGAEAQEIAAAPAASGGVGEAYDFTRMTPAQMAKVADKMFEAGQITSEQSLALHVIGPFGRINPDGSYTPPTEAERSAFQNTPMDFIQTAKDRMADIESRGRTTDPTSGYQAWKSVLALMQQLQSTPQSVDIRA